MRPSVLVLIGASGNHDLFSSVAGYRIGLLLRVCYPLLWKRVSRLPKLAASAESVALLVGSVFSQMMVVGFTLNARL